MDDSSTCAKPLNIDTFGEGYLRQRPMRIADPVVDAPRRAKKHPITLPHLMRLIIAIIIAFIVMYVAINVFNAALTFTPPSQLPITRK